MFKSIIGAGAAILLATSSAFAAPVERKLAQFGNPLEVRTTCVKWASGKWPWGGGWKTCIGHKYEMLQHEIYLVVSGPENLEEGVRQVLQEAAGAAIVAGVGAFAASPSPEPFTRAAAGLAAAKSAFVAYLAARGMERLAAQYDIRIDNRTHWS